MPLPNDPTAGDTVNTQCYLTPLALPQRSTFGVVRLDHDFGAKNHFMASYRYYGFSQLTSQQVDIGGSLPGNTLGQAAASAPRPQKPSYLVGGMTTTITPNLTNDFRIRDRKSTRLNSSHVRISYAVFCLKKKRRRWRADRTP